MKKIACNDIDDILLNTFGAVLGYLALIMVKKVWSFEAHR